MSEHDVADRQVLRCLPPQARAVTNAGVASRAAAGSPLGGVSCRRGDASYAPAHATTLTRLASYQRSSLHRSLLQLQRQYGNRYVGRVLRRASMAEIDSSGVDAIERSLDQARGSGHGLDHDTRIRMKGAFGADFSDVRIHVDAPADGRELLAHEHTHVVQQNIDSIPRNMTVSEPSDLHQLEVEQMTRAVMRHEDAADSASNRYALLGASPALMPQLILDDWGRGVNRLRIRHDNATPPNTTSSIGPSSARTNPARRVEPNEGMLGFVKRNFDRSSVGDQGLNHRVSSPTEIPSNADVGGRQVHPDSRYLDNAARVQHFGPLASQAAGPVVQRNSDSLHPEEQDAENTSKDPDASCDEIIRNIEVLIEELAGRLADLVKHNGGDAGHRERFQNVQQILRTLMTMAVLACKNGEYDAELAEEAEKWANKPLPFAIVEPEHEPGLREKIADALDRAGVPPWAAAGLIVLIIAALADPEPFSKVALILGSAAAVTLFILIGRQSDLPPSAATASMGETEIGDGSLASTGVLGDAFGALAAAATGTITSLEDFAQDIGVEVGLTGGQSGEQDARQEESLV